MFYILKKARLAAKSERRNLWTDSAFMERTAWHWAATTGRAPNPAAMRWKAMILLTFRRTAETAAIISAQGYYPVSLNWIVTLKKSRKRSWSRSIAGLNETRRANRSLITSPTRSTTLLSASGFRLRCTIIRTAWVYFDIRGLLPPTSFAMSHLRE